MPTKIKKGRNKSEKLLIKEFGKKEFFGREDLYDFYKKTEPKLSENNFAVRVHRLKEQRVVRVVKSGIYSLNFKPAFVPPLGENLRNLFDKIKKQYPFAQFCVWNTQWLNDFMIHQAGRFLLFIEAETDAAESIFFHLRDNGYKDIYLKPDEKVMSRYVNQEMETIIVKPLISKSPLQKINDVPIPKLEKILVDLFCEEITLRAFKGEMENIFKAAFEQFDINFSALLNYANRRGRKKELIKYMQQYTIAPENLFT